jgi:hypothetical protein
MKSSRRNIVRTVGAMGAATAVLIAGPASAFAHECFVASRSDQGNAMAGTHSNAWQTYSIQQVVTLFLGQTPAVASSSAQSKRRARVA